MNTRVYVKLERFLAELESTLQSEQAKRDFKTAKTRRVIAICVSAGVAFSSCATFLKTADVNGGNDPITNIAALLFLIGFFSLAIFTGMKGLFKAQTQRRLGVLANEFADYVQTIEVSGDDIVLSRIKGDAEAVYSGFTTPSPRIDTDMTELSQKKQSGKHRVKLVTKKTGIGRRGWGWFGVILCVVGIIRLVSALVGTNWAEGEQEKDIGKGVLDIIIGLLCVAWGYWKYGRKTTVTTQPPKKSEGTN